MNNFRFPLVFLLLLTTASFPAFTFAADQGSAALTTRVERLERRIGRLTELMLQVDTLKRENSELRGQIELQNHLIESLKKRQRDLYIDIDTRLSQMQGASVPASTAVPANASPKPVAAAVDNPRRKPVAPVPDSRPATVVKMNTPSSTIGPEEQAAYDKAYKMLVGGKRYPEAIKSFQAFLQSYPASRLAGNAQYWLAEAHYVSQQNDTALAEFKKVMTQYPSSSKVPDAMLKTAYLVQATNNVAEARKLLGQIISSYPRSSAANLARQRLKSIR